MDLQLYDLLGVPREANDVSIRSAYRHRALFTHPDKGGSAEAFLKLVQAFEILSDPERRAEYDRTLACRSSSDGMGKAPAAQYDEDAAISSPVPMKGSGSAASKRRRSQTTCSASIPVAAAMPSPLGSRAKASCKRRKEPMTNSNSKATSRVSESATCALLAELMTAENIENRLADLSYRSIEALLTAAHVQPFQQSSEDHVNDCTYPCSSAADGHMINERNEPGGRIGIQSAGALDADERVPGSNVGIQSAGALDADDHLPDTVMLALCDELEDTDTHDSSLSKAKVRGRPSRLRTHGVHHAHGKNANDYVAAVGWDRFYVTTRSTKCFADAIDWHVLLVRIRQLVKTYTNSGMCFNQATQTAVSEVLNACEVEDKPVPVLLFSAFFSVRSRKIAMPLTPDLSVALHYRGEVMTMISSGAGPEEVVAAKDRMAAAEKQKRAILTEERRVARKATKAAVRQASAAQAKIKLLAKVLKNRLKSFHRYLQVKSMPQGTDAIFFPADMGLQAFSFAQLCNPSKEADDSIGILCNGPLRETVSEAAEDRRMLLAVQIAKGNDAACARAEELDVEVATSRFLGTLQRKSYDI